MYFFGRVVGSGFCSRYENKNALAKNFQLNLVCCVDLLTMKLLQGEFNKQTF